MSEESKKIGKGGGGGGNGGVRGRVRCWVSDFSNEMRKKSHVVQKWVDSIHATEDDHHDDSETCDSNELNINEQQQQQPSTSECEASASGVKGKLSEICNKLSVNEKLKGKKIDLKTLIAKTTHKIRRQASRDVLDMEQQQEEEATAAAASDRKINIDKAERCDDVKAKSESITNISINNNKEDNDDSEQQQQLQEEENEEEGESETKSDTLTVQRCHISVLGRSSSENPDPPTRNRRLTDIGRSFSVAHDPDLPIDSTENLIYDVDEDISIAIPTFEAGASNKTNSCSSSSQLDRATLRPSPRPLREHTVSEGHCSPQVLPKNPLLRDSSFQSDSSHCSSVESLLEARKPDAEAILVNLGFGPVQGSDDVLSKIPKRFLKPSQVRGVDTDSFLKNQQLSMNIHENSVLGYRGLLGNPHTPPSDIVRAIMNRFSQNEMQRMASMENISPQRTFKGVANTILAQRHFMK